MIETRTCVIRAARADDLPVLTDIYNHYVETTASTFDVVPFTTEGRRNWFNQFSIEGPYRMLVSELGGVVVGYASSTRYRDKAAYCSSIITEIYMAPSACGQGLGRRLYESLFDAIRGEDLHRAYAAITVPNDPLLNLHRSMGFEKTGVMSEAARKFGKYWDVAWLAKSLA